MATAASGAACGQRSSPCSEAMRFSSLTRWTVALSSRPGLCAPVVGDSRAAKPEVQPAVLREHIRGGLQYQPFPALLSPRLPNIPRRVPVDQLVASPMCVWYFLGLGCLEGQSLHKSCQKLRDKSWKFCKADWCMWPAAQLVNFFFVPPQF